METFLLVTVGWVFSVCLHEFGHAFVAYRGGDHTVVDKGYLTLNPIHYTHPLYSLILPVVFLLLGGIGLPGGAVYINEHLLRSKQWRTATSLGGPAMNLVLILILCLPFWTRLLPAYPTPLACALAFLLQLQVCAVLFNLLPVPPLDGFQALAPWLPRQLSAFMYQHANIWFWVVLAVMWYVPAANRAFWTVVHLTSLLLGIDPALAILGWERFQFWHH